MGNPAEPNGTEPLRLEAGPEARRIFLPFDAVDATRFGVGELLDIAEAMDVDLAGLAALMQTPGTRQARLLIAIAWVLVRRLEPDVTFTEAQRWRLEVADTAEDPTEAGTPAPPTETAVGLEP